MSKAAAEDALDFAEQVERQSKESRWAKFFLDENANYGCLEPLRTIYRAHDFHHAFDEGLSSTDDIPLFETLAEQRYEAIITKHRQQQLVGDQPRRSKRGIHRCMNLKVSARELRPDQAKLGVGRHRHTDCRVAGRA